MKGRLHLFSYACRKEDSIWYKLTLINYPITDNIFGNSPTHPPCAACTHYRKGWVLRRNFNGLSPRTFPQLMPYQPDSNYCPWILDKLVSAMWEEYLDSPDQGDLYLCSFWLCRYLLFWGSFTENEILIS